MEIENTFTVAATPDAVYAYLVDVNQVVGCVPGAQLSEIVDPTTFRGKVKIKVGPVTVSYDGTARIVSRDEGSRTAAIEAEGREAGGPGSARATTQMSVTPEGEGSLVRFATDFTVVGRVAQFGRGIMEDVSRRIVDQMAACIRSRLEAAAESAPAAGASPNGTGPPDAGTGPATTPGDARPASASAEAGETAGPPPAVSPAPPAEPAALDALALARGVAADRLRRIRIEAVAGAVGLLLLLLGIRRRLRRRS